MASSLKGTYTAEDSTMILQDVYSAFRLASQYDMEPGVFYTALIFLKENPVATIHDALKAGLTDWDLEWDKF